MLSLIEPSQPMRFPIAAARPAPGPAFAEPTARVSNSASYQALLASLGLTPDPRLCVPAVER
jgi:hypothetical protein